MTPQKQANLTETTNSAHSTRMASVALPVFGIAMLSPISHDIIIPLGFWGDIAQDIVYFLFGGIALALVNLVASLFTGMIEIFLFPPAPSRIGGIEDLFLKSTFAFFSIISVTSLGYLGYMMVFPHNEKADPFRFVNRLFAAFIMVGAGKYLLNTVFVGVNSLGQYIYPNTFKIKFMMDSVLDIVAMSVGSLLTVLIGIIILYLTSLATIAGFFAILAIRALLMYAVYALLPIFVGLWVVDVGPFKYGNMVGELAFKAFALLLAFGILMSAILATGAAIASHQGDYDDFETPKEVEDIENWETSSGSASEHCDTVSGSTGSDCERNGIILKMMAFFGSLWATLAIGASSLGMLISMKGSGSGTASSSSGGGSGGGSGSMAMESNDSNPQAGAQSAGGKYQSAKQDIADADGKAATAKETGKKAFGGAVAGAKGLDSLGEKIASSGDKSMAQGAKDLYGKGKEGVSNQMSGGKPDSAVEDVQDNVDSLEGNQADLNDVTYDDHHGQLTDSNGDNGIDYEPGEDGPDLEDGQRYDMENVDIEKNDQGDPVAKGNEDTTAEERIPTGNGKS